MNKKLALAFLSILHVIAFAQSPSLDSIAKQMGESIQALATDKEKEHYLDSLYLACEKSKVAANHKSITYYYAGYYYGKIGQREQSAKAYQKAVIFAERESLLAGKAHWKLGNTLTHLEHLDSALYHLQMAQEYLEAEKTPTYIKYLSRTFRDLGNVYEMKGEYEHAKHFLLGAYNQYKAEQDIINQVILLNRLGVLAMEYQNYEKSLAYLEEAEKLYLTKYNDVTNVHFVDVRINKANVLLETENAKEAIPYYEEVLSVLPPENSNVISIFINLGFAYRVVNEYNKGLNALQNVVRLEKDRTGSVYSPALGIAYENMADIYLAQGNFNKALLTYHTALQQYIPDFRTEKNVYKNPNISKMKVWGTLRNLLNPLDYKAMTLKALYKKTNGRKDLLLAALDTYKTADQLIDLMRYEHTETQSKLFWRKHTRPIYEQALETAFLLNDAEAALYFLEKSKAVLLADAINDRSAKEKTNLPKEKLDQIQTLKKQLYQAEQKEDNRSKYLGLKKDLEDLIASLEEDYPTYYQYKYNRKVPSLATLRKEILDDSTAFIGYFVGDSIIYSLQVTKEETRLDKLPYEEEEHKQWLEMLDWATKDNLFDTKNKSLFLAGNKSLTAKLWKPLSKQTRRYLIAPDGWLNYLNFEMLVAPTANSLEPTAFLIHDYTFHYTWSATVSQYVAQTKAKASNQFLGIAPVTFTDSSKLGALKNSLKELNAIHGIIGGKDLTKGKANFENLQEFLEKDWRIIHWVTHAQANGQEPFIALHDRKILLSQLYQLDFSNTELVTLSACESNLGEWQVGEGVASIARACIYAGAQSIVASQWAVNDEISAKLMTHFYNNLKEGLPKDESLRQAKLALLKSGVPPAHWAAFVSTGNAATMEDLKGKTNWYSWLLGGLVLVLLVILILFFPSLSIKNQGA